MEAACRLNGYHEESMHKVYCHALERFDLIIQKESFKN